MTIAEIFSILGAIDDTQKAMVVAALEKIFNAKEDQYCVQQRFTVDLEKAFSDWDGLYIESTKLVGKDQQSDSSSSKSKDNSLGASSAINSSSPPPSE